MEIEKPAWERFESLVQRILEAHLFQINANDTRGDKGFDFLGKMGDLTWAIEVKFYRTKHVRAALIEAAAIRVINNGTSRQTDKGMLIVSSVLRSEYRLALEKKYSIVFVDRIDLRTWAASFPELLDELDSLIESDISVEDNEASKSINLESRKEKIGDRSVPDNDTRGTELCLELRSLKRGKNTWVRYESLCIKILKYLFKNDLEGWHKQKSSDGGANRYDFVCRVRPNTDYWKFIVENLNSRYVVFEFKNYSENIKQGQVLTTEKYLLERGLRKVAFIFARTGYDKNAKSVMQGAMREHGKLILCLNDDALCEMLHMKERGEDPTDYLFTITDEFLLALPR